MPLVPFWVSWGIVFLTCSHFVRVFSGVVLRAPSKRALGLLLRPKCAKMELSKGGAHAIRTRLRRFYEGRPVWQKVASRAASGANF